MTSSGERRAFPNVIPCRPTAQRAVGRRHGTHAQRALSRACASKRKRWKWTGCRPGPARKASLASGAGMTVARAARLPQRHPVQAYGARRRGPKARDPCTAPDCRAHAHRRASGGSGLGAGLVRLARFACERRRHDVGESRRAFPNVIPRRPTAQRAVGRRHGTHAQRRTVARLRIEEQVVKWTGCRPGPARKASLASGAGMTVARAARLPPTSSRAGLRRNAPWAEGTGPMHSAGLSRACASKSKW